MPKTTVAERVIVGIGYLRSGIEYLI